MKIIEKIKKAVTKKPANAGKKEKLEKEIVKAAKGKTAPKMVVTTPAPVLSGREANRAARGIDLKKKVHARGRK